ncbi:hypothetical protein [Primorskyibacter sp. S187A]|uniref:hypothetical protein n=1 Tax=Primorskyibacter sp. S187A TaxID=3415130 RepID=UPI003C7BA6BF
MSPPLLRPVASHRPKRRRAIWAATLGCALGAGALTGHAAPGTADGTPPAQPQIAASVDEVRVAGHAMAPQQAREVAAQALARGRNDIAIAIAEALIARDSEDTFGHFVLAQAFLRAGQADKARAPARRAFALAQTPTQKHEAARVAALTAATQERFLPAQIWMRRALQNAPTPEAEARAANEFRTVRRASKLRLRFALSVSPSNNVNGGASEEVHVVEGLPFVGILSPDALALSGTISRGRVSGGYVLHKTQTAVTEVVGDVQVQRVTLSADARDKAPMADAKNYGYTIAELGLAHRRLTVQGGPVLSFGAHLGRAWFGGDHAYDTQRAQLGLTQKIGDATELHLGHGRQIQIDADGTRDDVVNTSWSLALSHKLGNADRLSAGLFLGETEGDNVQIGKTTRGLSLGYARAKPVGPLELSASLRAQESHYPDYHVIFPVPGGRWDTQLSAQIDIGLHQLDYMGFIPTLSVKRQKTSSNVGRFDTEATSISIGFKSQF